MQSSNNTGRALNDTKQRINDSLAGSNGKQFD